MASKKTGEVDKLQLEVSQVTRTQSLLNSNQIQKIFNSTPKRYKYVRPAKGGGNWTYIKSSYVRRTLDSVFGFNWSFDIETTLAEAFEVAKITKVCTLKCSIIARVKADGEWVELKKTQFGRAEVKFKTEVARGENGAIIYEEDSNGKRKPKKVSTNEPLDFGNDMKAAASDGLKKCASLFGIGADVYEPEEFVEFEIIGSDQAKASTKATKKKLEQAKREMVAEEAPNDKRD